MIPVRLLKIAKDLGLRRGRTLLTLLGLSVGLFGVCAVLTAFSLLAGDLGANYRETAPPDIVASAGAVSPGVMRTLAALPGVDSIERRDAIGVRVEIAPQRWMGMTLFVVEDFAALKVARFYPEAGAWPPPAGQILMERDGKFFLHAPPGSALRLRLPDGNTVSTVLAGHAFDPGQAPSRMEMALYGYITRATAEGWGMHPARTRLLFTAHRDIAAPAGAEPVHALADRIAAALARAGVPLYRIVASETAEHPHAFQFRAILALLAALAAVSLLMCVALIVNLIDSIMAAEQRAIGVMKALGARSVQIGFDYLLGMAALGLAAVALCLPFALRIGIAIGEFVAAFINFKLLSTSPPLWLVPAIAALGVLLPLLAAGWRVARTAALPVREALMRNAPAQANVFPDRFGRLGAALPLLPRMALRTLARKPRRTLLTALTLTLGLVFFLTSLNLRSSLLETVAAVQRTKPHDLDVSFRDAYPVPQLEPWIRAFPSVGAAEFWSSAEVTLTAGGRSIGQPVPLLGVPPATAAIRPDVIAGTWLAAAEPDAIVVTQKLLADVPQLHLGGTYRLHSGDRFVDARIGGVVREFGPGLVYAQPALYERIAGGAGTSNLMLVTLRDSSFPAQRRAASQIEENLVGSDWQVHGVLTTRLLEAIVRSHLDVILYLLLVISGIALFIGATGLASSISVSVVERYREVGVMKAIGAGSRAVALLFACEAVFIALLGWGIAVAIAPFLSRFVATNFGNLVIQYPFDYRAAEWGSVAALAVAVGIALLASGVPIRSALQLTPRAALRTE